MWKLEQMNGLKLVINTEKNDGVYTVDNVQLFDKVYYKYEISTLNLTQSQNLLIELTLKTDVPIVYVGGLDLSGSIIKFTGGESPNSLKPGVQFVLPLSTQNTNFLVVDSISQFIGNSNLQWQ
jgi:hypothetical protein